MPPTATPARKIATRNMTIHGSAPPKALSPSAISFFSMSPVAYFGQPSAGFFFDRDFFTRSFQFPVSFNLSAFGPGVAFLFLEWFELLTTFFLLTRFNILSFRNWVFIHQPFSFCCPNRSDSALAVIHLAIVPKKIELPKIPMQVSAADIVIDADQTAPNQGVTAFSGIHVNIATGIFKRPMADRFMGSSPGSLSLCSKSVPAPRQTRASGGILFLFGEFIVTAFWLSA
jgi:hypothetical protein